MATMSTPHLYLLGPPHFEHDGHPVDLPPAKAMGLLAYLALTPGPQPREAILALLWPESYAEAARKNLRNTLWAVRKALGDDVLDAGDDRLALADSAWVDVREFERRGDPILYGGLLLDGLGFGDAPDFDLWLGSERERLEQQYLRALAA